MCFSADASFGAAITLGALGAAAVRASPSRRHLPLASVPLLLGAQQAFEGALWLALEGELGSPHAPFVSAFLFVALFVWPSYLPWALWLLEPRGRRRAILARLMLSGSLLGAYLFGTASLRPSEACIAFGNLYYAVHVDAALRSWLIAVYLASVALPFLISSVRGTTVLAVLTVTTCAAAATLYQAGFLSVWCFFAAALSGAVVLVVRVDTVGADAWGRTALAGKNSGGHAFLSFIPRLQKHPDDQSQEGSYFAPRVGERSQCSGARRGPFSAMVRVHRWRSHHRRLAFPDDLLPTNDEDTADEFVRGSRRRTRKGDAEVVRPRSRDARKERTESTS